MAIDDGDPKSTGRPITSDGLPSERMSPEAVRVIYEVHGRDLLTFLTGVLRNADSAQDVCQLTFQRLLEAGHTVQADTLRGWLFRVAFHEAMAFRRKESRRNQVQLSYSETCELQQLQGTLDSLVKAEEVARLRALLSDLPPDQRDVVQRRMGDDRTFAEIAHDLNVPLGTVLTRMRMAMQKLQRHFGIGRD